MEEGREERKVNEGERERERERVHKYSGRQRMYRENAEEEKKTLRRGGQSEKEAAAVGWSELREREINACQGKTGGQEGRGTGERGRRGGDVPFRLSGVCFECMCGTQSGLKASSTPLNLHSQSSFFIPLITWLSSDQSTASPA